MENENKVKAIEKLINKDTTIPISNYVLRMYGVQESLLLGFLCQTYRKELLTNKLEDSYFTITQEEIENNILLSRYQQFKCTQKLEHFNLLKVKKAGLPKRNFYAINIDLLLELERKTTEGE